MLTSLQHCTCLALTVQNSRRRHVSASHSKNINSFNTLYYFSKPYHHTLHYVTVVMLSLQQFVQAPCRHSWQDIKVHRLDILHMHYASAKFHENSLTVSSKKFLANYRVRLITCSSHGSGNIECLYTYAHTNNHYYTWQILLVTPPPLLQRQYGRPTHRLRFIQSASREEVTIRIGQVK